MADVSVSSPCRRKTARMLARRPLKITVAGAGISGLCSALAFVHTGHHVTIVESRPRVTEIGAGIQLALNATRALARLDVLDEVINFSSKVRRVDVRRYADSKKLSSWRLSTRAAADGEAPSLAIHRGDLQHVLLRAVESRGCRIVTSCKAVGLGPSLSAELMTEDVNSGMIEWVESDIIIAADGQNSTLRQQMALAKGFQVQKALTADTAYRVMVSRDKVSKNPSLLGMLDQDVALRYIGPNGHVMAYPLRNNSLFIFNMVFIHSQPSPRSPAQARYRTGFCNQEELLEAFEGWAPILQDWIRCADPGIMRCPLFSYSDLPTWHHGRIVLVGDACHPMLPYVAQGAANAIEDAMALATAFACTSDIQQAFELYEGVRKDRAERIARIAARTGSVLHLPDGPEQQERDQSMLDAAKTGYNPDCWEDVSH